MAVRLHKYWIIFSNAYINSLRRAFDIYDICLPLETQRQISDFLVSGVSLVPLQNFRLLFLETDSKGFLRYRDNFAIMT